MASRGPVYRRERGKRRTTELDWVVGIRSGSLLDVVTLGPATGTDAIEACEAEELAEAALAGVRPARPKPMSGTDAIAALTADITARAAK